jgi:hypothetical protein
MADAATITQAGPGHNQGPLDLSRALDAEQLLADLQADTLPLFGRAKELLEAFVRFDTATKDGIPDEATLGRAGDFVRQLTAHITTVEARRTAVKKPVLEAQRTIDGFFRRDLSDPIEAAKRAVTKRMDDFFARVRQAAQEAARAEAARQREAAEQLAAQAEAQRSDTLMAAAVEAEARAETLAAARVAPAAVRSDYGTTVHTRQGPWKVRVVDITQVPAAYLMINEQVLLATAKTNAAVAAGEQPIAGVEFYRETTVGVR